MALLVSGTPRGRWISTGVPKLTAKTKVNSRCRQVMMPREKPRTPTIIFDGDIIPYSGAWPWSKRKHNALFNWTQYIQSLHKYASQTKGLQTLNELTLIFIQMMVTYKSHHPRLIQSEMASAHTANTTHWNTHPTEVINNTESR